MLYLIEFIMFLNMADRLLMYHIKTNLRSTTIVEIKPERNQTRQNNFLRWKGIKPRSPARACLYTFTILDMLFLNKGCRHMNIQMKNIFLLPMTILIFLGCSSNPNKAEKIDTQISNAQSINSETTLGLKDGNMIVQRKVDMNEELRKLQYEVYELEDRVYGNRKYGSLGLYGVLRECKSQLADTKNGGDGKLIWTEPMDRITDKEDEFKIGIDEKNKLVAVSEEFLKDRIERFRGYKKILNSRQDEYEEKVAICKTTLKSKQ